MHITHRIGSSLILASFLLAPASAYSAAEGSEKFASGQPFHQELVVTAYYSPKADQCCYVTGSFASDVTLNGRGTHGADGTPVYPGMVAAPGSYPFGTTIVIEGLGTFTVHDRGGAINAGEKTDRLDVWAGEGEVGLARALAFGVQEVSATIYPPSAKAPAGNFVLESLSAPLERLKPYFVASTSLVSLKAVLGDHTASVEYLQEKLRQLGMFSGDSSGLFGPATQVALTAFLAFSGYTSEPSDRLTEKSAAAIEAALRRKDAPEPIAKRIAPGSSVTDVAALQRTLRFLDLYRGRTDGTFNPALAASVLALQKKSALVGDASSPGAGTVGPKTREVILTLWRQRHIALLTDRVLANHRVDQLLADSGLLPDRQLSKGYSGNPVRTLQSLLAKLAFFPKGNVNGNYGDLTHAAVLAYQKDRGIVTNDTDRGAGVVGPTTLQRMRSDLEQSVLSVVRANGWDAAKNVL